MNKSNALHIIITNKKFVMLPTKCLIVIYLALKTFNLAQFVYLMMSRKFSNATKMLL